MFARGSNGAMVVSDRETIGISSNAVEYVHLYEDSGVFLALGGNPLFNKFLFSRSLPKHDGPHVVLETLDSWRRDFYTEPNNSRSSEGFLIMKGEHAVLAYAVKFTKDRLEHDCITYTPRSIGDGRAEAIVHHNLRNVNFCQITCEEISRKLIASINEASQSVASVGDMSCGFDAVAFLNDGKIMRGRGYGLRRALAQHSPDPASDTILSECVVGGA